MNIKATHYNFDINGLLIEYKTHVEGLLTNINSSPPVLVQRMFCISNYKVHNSILKDMPITKQVIDTVSMLIRYTTIAYRVVMPNTCYSWHVDTHPNPLDPGINYHIPIDTNEGCHFVYQNESYHMPANGSLYEVKNSIPHSFMNAGKTQRVHILFES